jgi:hypothetical protein
MVALSEAARYRSSPFVRLPLGGDQELLYFPLARMVTCVDTPTAIALDCWKQFEIVDVACISACSQIPSLSYDVLKYMFQELLARGGLIEEGQFHKLASEDAPAPKHDIQFLAIPTRDRSLCLTRSVSSYLANLEEFGRECTLLISDDSKPQETRQRNRDMLEKTARRSANRILYVDRDAKQRIATHLANASIPTDVLDFGIFGDEGCAHNYGANRNAILLCTVGSRLLSVDDDTICQLGVAPLTDATDNVTFSPHRQPLESWRFLTCSEAKAFVMPASFDVVAKHERYLGSSLPNIVQRSMGVGGEFDPSAMCAHIITTLLKRKGRVLMTYAGLSGISGAHSDLAIVASPLKGTRTRLQQAGTSYRNIVPSRAVVMQATRATVTHCSWGALALCFGLDNTALVPPYVPSFRNEDGIFSLLLEKCSEDGYACHLPFTVEHEPTNIEYFTASTHTGLRMSEVIMGCLSLWRPQPYDRTMPGRLASVGAHFKEIGSLPEGDFQELVATLLSGRLAAAVETLEGCLSEEGYSSSAWADDAAQRIDELLVHANTIKHFAPSDLEGGDAEHVLARAQKFIATYGELLKFWPAIVAEMSKFDLSEFAIASKRN